MAKDRTVLSAGQMKELASAIVEGIPADLSPDIAQVWIKNKGKLSSEIRRVLLEGFKAVVLSSWQDFYEKFFKIKIDLSNLRIPEHQAGFDWLIVVAPGVTPGKIFERWMELFLEGWAWTENLAMLVQSERVAKDIPYACWARAGIEPDEEFAQFSADEIKDKCIPCITLEERLLLGLKVKCETKEYLDQKHWTLCAGSRYSDGKVPVVYYSDENGLVIDQGQSWKHNICIRGRRVIA